MKENSLSFKIKIDSKDLYIFNLYHNFWQGRGKIILGFSLLMIALLPVALFVYKDGTMALVMFIAAGFYLIIAPLQMFLQSKKTYIETKFYHEVIRYEIKGDLLTIKQSKDNAEVLVNDIRLIVSAKDYFFIYLTPIRALIIPKRFLKPEEVNYFLQLKESLTSVETKKRFSFRQQNDISIPTNQENLEELEEVIMNVHDTESDTEREQDYFDNVTLLHEMDEAIENEVYDELIEDGMILDKKSQHPIQQSTHLEGLDYDTFGQDDSQQDSLTIFEIQEEMIAQEDVSQETLSGPILKVTPNKSKKKKKKR